MNVLTRLTPLAIFVLIVIPFSYFADFYTRGEGREALNVKSACEGETLWPRNYDGQRSSKPPMYYWLSCPAYKVFPSEFAIRLPSVTTALLIILAILYPFCRLFGEKTAIIAALMLVTSTMFVSNAEIARLDMLHSGSLALSWLCIIGGASWGSSSIFGGLALAVSTLTKGPVAILLTALSFATLYFLLRDCQILLRAAIVLLIAVVLSGIWYIAVYSEFGKAFLQVFWYENVNRFIGENVPHSKSAVEFLLLVFAGLSPVGLCVLVAKILSTIRERNVTISKSLFSYNKLKVAWRSFISSDRLVIILATLIAIPLIFYSFSEGKRPAYGLVSVIFASILLGIYAARMKRMEKIYFFKIFDFLAQIVIVVLVVAFISGLAFIFMSQDNFVRSMWPALTQGLLSAIFLALIYRRARRVYLFNPFSSFIGSALFVVATAIFLFNTLLGISFSKLLSHKKLATWLNRVNTENLPIFSFNYEYYATKFYLGREIRTFRPFERPPMFIMMPEASVSEFAERFWLGRRIPEIYATYPGRVDKLRNKTVLIRID